MDKNSASAREWHVRKALPEELKMVAEIERLSFSRPWSLESIESFITEKQVIFMYGETGIVSVDILLLNMFLIRQRYIELQLSHL